MLLAEYDFEVVHKKGTQMGHVDGMNRSELTPETEDLDDTLLKEIWEAGLEIEAEGNWD